MELMLLTFATFGFVIAFAYLNVRAMEKRRSTGAPKSTLSTDGRAEWLARQTATKALQ